MPPDTHTGPISTYKPLAKHPTHAGTTTFAHGMSALAPQQGFNAAGRFFHTLASTLGADTLWQLRPGGKLQNFISLSQRNPKQAGQRYAAWRSSGGPGQMAFPYIGGKPILGETWGQLSRAEIRSRPWYRGDVSAHTHDQIDPAKFDYSSMYGPGLYLTDRPQLASAYADKGAENFGPTSQSFIVDRKNARTGKLTTFADMLDQARAAKDWVRTIGDPIPGERFQTHRTGDPNQIGRYAIWYTPHGLGPNVKGFAVNPRTVVSAERPVGPVAAAKLEAQARRPDRYDGEKMRLNAAMNAIMRGRMGSGAQLFNALAMQLGHRGASEFMAKSGIDALQYHGGAAMGGDPHNALAVYNMRAASPNPGITAPPATEASARAQQTIERWQQMTAAAIPGLRQMAAQQGKAVMGRYPARDLESMALGAIYNLPNGRAIMRNPAARDLWVKTFLANATHAVMH